MANFGYWSDDEVPRLLRQFRQGVKPRNTRQATLYHREEARRRARVRKLWHCPSIRLPDDPDLREFGRLVHIIWRMPG